MTLTTDNFEKQRKFIFYPGDEPGVWNVTRQGNTMFRIGPAEDKFQVMDVRLPAGPHTDVVKQFDTVDAAGGYVVGLLTHG